MWQIIMTVLSAGLFFSFVAACIYIFGIQSCYSAYGQLWQPKSKAEPNWWQIITGFTAIVIIPVLLQTGENNPWQFLCFLAPVSLLLVAATPDYQEDKFKWWLHQIGAWSAVVFICLYAWKIPKLLWVIIPFAIIAIVLSFVFGFKKTWMLWAEMAMYAMTYAIIFAII